jgi:hypothetical protein
MRDAKPKPPREYTEEQRQRHVYLTSLRRFTRIINTNFTPRSLYSTLTFDNNHEVHEFRDADAALANFIRRLKYIKPGVQVVAVMGKGANTSRIHVHMLSNGVTREEIETAWKNGPVVRIENLKEHN